MRSLLSYPLFYRLFTQIVGGGRSRFVSQYVCPRPGDRILDLGCGPGDILEHLPGVHYIGVDMHRPYVDAARERYGDRATFLAREIGRESLDDLPASDIVLARGLIHHLDDETAGSLITVAHSALKKGGRLVTLDGCYVDGQSPIARFIIARDRGDFVRDEVQYIRLASQIFDKVESHILDDLIRMPYTHIILECTA